MPRRNSVPQNAAERSRNRGVRRGQTMVVWDSTGKPQEMKVLHANRHWIDLIAPDGTRTWVAARGLIRG